MLPCKSIYNKVENTKIKKMELVKTPNVKSIKDASEYLKVFPNKLIKIIN